MRDDERRGGSVSEKDDYILSKDSSKGELLCNDLFFLARTTFFAAIKVRNTQALIQMPQFLKL